LLKNEAFFSDYHDSDRKSILEGGRPGAGNCEGRDLSFHRKTGREPTMTAEPKYWDIQAKIYFAENLPAETGEDSA
jgi:hypothetical protein